MSLDNMKLNKDMLDNLKNMLGEQQVNEAMSKISPEMIENFSNTMNSNKTYNEQNSYDNNDSFNNNQSNENNFNFDNIDMATIMKLQTILNKMNDKKNDPRSNLLNSLKPYLRESRKENVDKYSNLLKIADLASLLNTENNDKKEDYPYNE